MAVLSDADRILVWERWMRDNHETCTITRQDLRAAVNALDDFMEANAATINAALPLPARTNLSTTQKAHLLSYVVLKRWGGQ